MSDLSPHRDSLMFMLQDGWIIVGIVPAQKYLLFWSSLLQVSRLDKAPACLACLQ